MHIQYIHACWTCWIMKSRVKLQKKVKSEFNMRCIWIFPRFHNTDRSNSHCACLYHIYGSDWKRGCHTHTLAILCKLCTTNRAQTEQMKMPKTSHPSVEGMFNIQCNSLHISWNVNTVLGFMCTRIGMCSCKCLLLISLLQVSVPIIREHWGSITRDLQLGTQSCLWL